ncbi:hypothetical protein WA577_004596 [Blastocystis sp. JDR]
MDSSAKSTLRKGGIEELSSTNGRKRALPAKELQSHVPSEVTVTKYGYIEHRVIGVLDSILDYGGFLSAATRKSVSFDHIEVSPNGRDINILYHIHKFSHDDSIRRSLSLEEEEEFDNLPIANERYVKERRNRSAPSSSLLENKRKELQKTRRYQHYPLSLEDVRIIDEIERSTKPIRFELCKQLNIKRVPQLHFIHSTK